MAQATCLFVGAAAPPDDGDNPAREARKRRLVKSVQHDFQRMVEFVTKTSTKKRGAPVGARVSSCKRITRISRVCFHNSICRIHDKSQIPITRS